MSIEFQTSLDGLDAADADMDFDPVRELIYCLSFIVNRLLLMAYC